MLWSNSMTGVPGPQVQPADGATRCREHVTAPDAGPRGHARSSPLCRRPPFPPSLPSPLCRRPPFPPSPVPAVAAVPEANGWATPAAQCASTSAFRRASRAAHHYRAECCTWRREAQQPGRGGPCGGSGTGVILARARPTVAVCSALRRKLPVHAASERRFHDRGNLCPVFRQKLPRS